MSFYITRSSCVCCTLFYLLSGYSSVNISITILILNLGIGDSWDSEIPSRTWVLISGDGKPDHQPYMARLRWPNTVFARAFADAIQRAHKDCKKTNMLSIERSFYLRNTRTICVIFLYNWTQCIDGFSLLLQRYVRKGNDAKNPAILSFFFVTERTQLNAAHA